MKALQKTAISAAAVALLTGLSSISAFAEEAAAEAPEVSPVTANVTVTNNYIYRGITQTNGKPAIQGGFDYAHESGFYIGNWNSSITWVSDGYKTSGGVATSAPIEMDFYGGFKKEFIGEGFASDIGVLQYYYPTSGIQATPSYVNPNTTEIYAAQNFTFGPVTGFAKVSYAVTTLFGNANSTGSYYPDLTLNYDTGFWGITANGHVGYQYVGGNQPTGSGTQFGSGVSNNTLFSYADWKLGLTKDFGGGLSGAIAYTGTNAKTYQGSYAWYSPQGKNNGRSFGLVSLTKAF
jgi:uncharacterized protein (TIGR02001 family)